MRTRGVCKPTPVVNPGRGAGQVLQPALTDFPEREDRSGGEPEFAPWTCCTTRGAVVNR